MTVSLTMLGSSMSTSCASCFLANRPLNFLTILLSSTASSLVSWVLSVSCAFGASTT